MVNTFDRDKRLYQKLVRKYGEDAIFSAINEMKMEKRRNALLENRKESSRLRHSENFNVILTD